MILAIFVGFFIVAGAIAIPQFILKECGELTIRKSIIVRVIMSFCFFIAFVIVYCIIESKDQNIKFWDYLINFFKLYSKPIKDYQFADLWQGFIELERDNRVVWVYIFMFFPQLTLLIPQFLFIKFKEYAEYTEENVMGRIRVSVDSYGGVDTREDNVYSTSHPYLWRTAVAIIASVAIFIPILFVIIKYLSALYTILIIFVIDIIILILACRNKKIKE